MSSRVPAANACPAASALWMLLFASPTTFFSKLSNTAPPAGSAFGGARSGDHVDHLIDRVDVRVLDVALGVRVGVAGLVDHHPRARIFLNLLDFNQGNAALRGHHAFGVVEPDRLENRVQALVRPACFGARRT